MDELKVLVVDDEDSIRHVLNRVLEMKGCEVRQAGSAEDALPLLDDWEPCVALVDIVLPGKNGIQLLSEIKQAWPTTEVLIMTSNSSADTALQAIRRGAHDYLHKPFKNLQEVWTHVQKAVEKRNLALKNRALLERQEEQTRELSQEVALAREPAEVFDAGSLSEILDDFLSVVMRELDVDRASLMLLDKRQRELRIAASRGIPIDDLASIRVPVGEGIAGRVAKSGETFLVEDTRTDRRVDPVDPALSSSFISAPIVFSVAIKSERDVLGVINVTNRRNGEPFSSDDVTKMSALANQMAIMIENARQSDQLRSAYESLKQAQQQLVFNERIKAVGQMAAGVAHDFNNVLSVILARAQFALAKLDGDDLDAAGIRNDLETILKTSLQGAETIKRIQDYTRIRKDVPSCAVDLNTVIRDAVEIARPKWKEQSEAEGKQIDVQLSLAEVPQVSGNVYELTQVVGNLIFNAVEAMTNDGVIRLRTENRGESVAMVVSDTGSGMDDETRERLFEPFFTTKETGQGLGMSIIFGIVSRHGGEIAVDSKVGEGTTFTVLLPRATVAAAAATAIEPDLPHQTAKVLLVDDDELVRETYQEALISGGHEVVAVDTGNRALDACRSERFDLVITDLSLPGMSGLEVASAVKEMHPDLPIVLFSGWAKQELETKVKDAGVDHILVKPCLVEDLLQTVQTAIRETDRGVRNPGVDQPRILVVDDEPSVRHVLQRLLTLKECRVETAGSAEQALALLDVFDPEVALVDIVLPGKSGIDLLAEVRQRCPDTEVIVITSQGSVDTAIAAIRFGANDYLQKPFAGLESVWLTVTRALDKRLRSVTNRELMGERTACNAERTRLTAQLGPATSRSGKNR